MTKWSGKCTELNGDDLSEERRSQKQVRLERVPKNLIR